MSFATLGDLRSRVFNALIDQFGAELAAPALQGELPDLIALAEARMHYGGGLPGIAKPAPPLRVRDMEVSADLVFTAGSAPLPSDYLDARRLYWPSSPNVIPEYVPAETFWANSLAYAGSPYPVQFTVEGGSVVVNPSSIAGAGKLLYWKKYAGLSAPSDTNWVLVNLPAVYLQGVLAECFRHLGMPEHALQAGGQYMAAVESANQQMKMSRFMNGPLRRATTW